MRKLEIGPNKDSGKIDDTWETLNVIGNPDIKADLEDLPLPIEDDTYDLIYLSHVLEHLHWFKGITILKELYRILKPNGIIEIWVPDTYKLVQMYLEDNCELDSPKPLIYNNYNTNNDTMVWLNMRLFAGWKGKESQHRACYDFRHLGNCLLSAGFKDIKRLKKPRGYNHGYINLGMSAQKGDKMDIKLDIKKEDLKGKKILDVGGNHYTMKHATHIIDIEPKQKDCKLDYVQMDICDGNWPYKDNEFDYVYCSNTLEDIKDPTTVCKEMMRVGKAGKIIVPSIILECTKGIDGWGRSEKYSGYFHHRWLCFIKDNEIIFMPKTPLTSIYDWTKVNKVPAEKAMICLDWKDSFEFTEFIAIGWLRIYDFLKSIFGNPLDAEEEKLLEGARRNDEVWARQWISMKKDNKLISISPEEFDRIMK